MSKHFSNSIRITNEEYNHYLVLKQKHITAPDTRVRCTADGEFPSVNQMVRFEVNEEMFIGGCEQRFEVGSHWFSNNDTDLEYYFNTVPIYWQPLTSLKAQYEREHGQP